MIKIKKSNFENFIGYLKKDFCVYAPAKEGKKYAFKKIDSIKDIANDLLNVDKSPKEIFFPQSEVLFQYSEEGMKVPERKEKPYAIWGMRNCDTKSFLMLDKVFGDAHQIPDKDMYKDPYWIEKYKTSVIFNIACNEPVSTCFCNWFEGGPFEKKGADVFVVDTIDFYFMEAVSGKGKKVLANYDKTEDVSKKELPTITELQSKAESYLSQKIDISNLFDKLSQIWDEPVWEEISEKCVNCGACAFVCPTCHCFDVTDEGKNEKGKRIRLWDSCMFPLFTKEASGHNPRAISVQRFRQRVMHKYNYFMDNYDEHLCTGCGRCVLVCPVNVDIREIIKTILDHKI